MGRQRPTPPGKTRTRQHIIADLAINHLERQVLLCGYTVERVYFDYGYDLAMFTYNPAGEVEPGWMFFQVKATDRLPVLRNGKTISWPVSRRDLKLWLRESYPVILVVYDSQSDKAYFLDIQSYFANRSNREIFTAGETVNVRISLRSRISRTSIEKLAGRKREIHQQLRQTERFHD